MELDQRRGDFGKSADFYVALGLVAAAAVAGGQYLDFGINTRTGGVRVEPGLDRPSIGIAAGATKVPAIRGALKSRILNGLVTDMPTAEALLSAG